MIFNLQLSVNPNFTMGTDPETGNDLTLDVPAWPISNATAAAQVDLAFIYEHFAISSTRTLYWRIGGTVRDLDPSALVDANQNGWVYSAPRSFPLPPPPPVP